MFRFGDPGGRIYTSAGTAGANILTHWTLSDNIAAWSVSSSAGRNGGSSLRLTTAFNNSSRLIKTLDAQSTWGIAFAYRTPNITNVTVVIAGFQDAGTAQIDLRVNPDGTLSITRNGTVLGTSSVSLSTNSYVQLELKVTIHPSAGIVELRRYGVPIIGPLTGLNTRNSANSFANQVFLGYASSSTTSGPWDYDDIIIWDSQTTDANGFADIHDFIGDCALAWLLPNGAGTTTQFTPDSGSNYARVNETTPDGDTTYVESSTIGNIDTYAMADLAGTIATVKSVAVIHYAEKTDVGSRGMKAELRSGGGNTAHATEIALSNSYQYYFSNFGQDPNNGTPTNWSVSAVNALESGETVSS